MLLLVSGRFENAISDQEQALRIKPDFDSAKQCLQQSQIELTHKIQKLDAD